MLEGLEVSIINLSETQKNKDFRTDSDFYTKAPLLNPKLNYISIGEILKKSQYGVSIEMNEEGKGYPIYRMNEIHNMLCDLDVNKHADVSQEEFNIFRLNDRDVLFNRTNSYEWVGRTGLYKKQSNKDFIFASYLVRFVPNEQLVLPEFLAAFLSSKQGVQDIKRRSRPSINQTNVNPEEVKAIQIPLFSLSYQNKIKTCFDKAYEHIAQSQTLYTTAEHLLLDALGLHHFQPSSEKVNIKSFKESFGATGRLDAEYYQVKYEDSFSVIKSYEKGCGDLKDICTIKGNFMPDKDLQYQYIELSDIGKNGEIIGSMKGAGADLPTRARQIVSKGDVMVSSIEGSLASCAIVSENYHRALCSTGFYVVNSKQINSETLLVLFKSYPIQNLLKKGCTGTILTAINKEEFSKIPLPLIEKSIQQQIAHSIQTSHHLRAESERLLSLAKRAVEVAIEEGEEAGMRLLEKG